MKLERAIGVSRDKSCPGLDGIEYKIFKKLTKRFREELLKRMNYAFRNNHNVQRMGRNSNTFYRKEKEKNVRPISTSSCVGKVLERMINERIIWLMEKEGWLDKKSKGFRRDRSCTDNLVRLTAEIDLSRETKQNLIVVFLDIKFDNAYDNVRMDILCDILRKKTLGKILRYVDVWVRNRVTKFSVGNDSEEIRLVNKGLPQGGRGVLSPTMYNVYIHQN